MMKEKLEYYRSLSFDDLIKLPMEQFKEYLSLLVEAHNESFRKSLNEDLNEDYSDFLGLGFMECEEANYWVNYMESLPDLALSRLHLFVRKMTDTPVVVESKAIDFFHDMEEICVYSICSRFAAASGALRSELVHREEV